MSKLIEKVSEKRLGLKDVEPDIIGRSYEYLIRKFAEGSGQSAGEFYTPTEVEELREQESEYLFCRISRNALIAGCDNSSHGRCIQEQKRREKNASNLRNVTASTFLFEYGSLISTAA